MYSGQRLGITVHLKLTEELKFRDIAFQLSGRIRMRFVKWKIFEQVLDMRQDLVSKKGGNVLFIGFVLLLKMRYNMKTFACINR